MGKVDKYLDMIIEKNNQEDMDEVGELFIEMAEHLEKCNKDMYHRICTKMYELAYGKVISEEKAEEWVENMTPEARWDIEETTNAMRQLGYNFNPQDFWIVANMMYSDYYDLVKDDETLALKMAYHWLNDKDTDKDKLYNYFKYVVKEV